MYHSERKEIRFILSIGFPETNNILDMFFVIMATRNYMHFILFCLVKYIYIYVKVFIHITDCELCKDICQTSKLLAALEF